LDFSHLGCLVCCFVLPPFWWKGIAHCGWAEWQGGKVSGAGKSARGNLGKGRAGFYGGSAGITNFWKWEVGGIDGI